MFKAVSQTILSWCAKEGFVPGVCIVLHTFGGKLNFHAHLHVLLTLGGLGDDSNFDFNIWQDHSFFPAKWLKTEFKRLLLKQLRQLAKEKLLIIPNELKKLWWQKHKLADFYRLSQKLWQIIWYVHIGEKLDNAEYTTQYIGRYAKRPCLSETKIIDYDQVKGTVTFAYKDKISQTDEQLTLSIEEFIIRIIRHIPEKNFRMIRYYGLYANPVKNKLLPVLLYQITVLFGIAKLTFSPEEQPSNWRERITMLTGNDPLFCSDCKVQMKLTEIGYRSRDGTFKTHTIF